MKRKTICLIIITILLIILPIAVLAYRQIGIPVCNEITEEEIVKQKMEETEKSLKINEKKKSSLKNNNTNQDEAEEIKEKEEKNLREEKIKSIVNKFYPNKLEELITKLEKESEGVIITNNTVFEAQKEIYYLIIDVLETKELSEDERNILIEFLEDTYVNVSGDDALQNKIDTILK